MHFVYTHPFVIQREDEGEVSKMIKSNGGDEGDILGENLTNHGCHGRKIIILQEQVSHGPVKIVVISEEVKEGFVVATQAEDVVEGGKSMLVVEAVFLALLDDDEEVEEESLSAGMLCCPFH